MRFFLRRRPGLWPVTAAILGTSFLAFAAVMDTFGPPPAGDPSAFTGPLVGETQAVDNLAALPPAHEGAFEGGPTGTHEDAHEHIVTRTPGAGPVDVPTGATPSPLFGAQPF